MGIRKFRPTTPGQRHKAIGTFDDVTAVVPEKSLVFGKRSTGGRNNQGRMTVRYRGGGHKRLYRIIDFKRDKDGIPAVVKTTRTVRHVSLCFSTLTVRNVTSLLQTDCKWVQQ